MTLISVLILGAAFFIALPAGGAAGRTEADLRMRAGVVVAIGVILIGLHTLATKTAGHSGASSLLATLAGALILYGIVYAAAGYVTRSATWVGETVSRRSKKKEEPAGAGEPKAATDD
ncbi:hypothetical protein ACT17_06200 [Mycolicibacterium conceptionense]|uniref:Transmembrane protein n=1 Tax=Mycolicibacterium conceptionense TaxID=451644 RepID=A0A0J8UGV8_9MYCO|nr:hypothetical protein [Mycolicibacterium conceptionense]KMV19630.1 hypothetical protein ACT17_06200 [Mycolicibacterium conceptionense]